MFDILRFADVSPIWLLVIAIVLLVLFTFIFTKGKAGKTFFGMLKVLGFIFSSPFIYYKKCFINLGDVGERRSEDIENNQYLLNKLLLVLEVFLILLSVMYLSHGVIVSWNGFLPPEYLRNYISQTEKYIDNTKTQIDSLQNLTKKYDNTWAQQKDKLISDYKNQQQINMKNASDNNAQIERQYATTPLFITLRNYLMQNINITDTYTLNQINQNSTNWLNSNVYDPNLRSTLFNYLSNWRIIKEANNAINNVSESEIRSRVQPDYEGLSSQLTSLSMDIQNSTQNLISLRQQAKYDFAFFAENLGITLLTFLFYIWVIGLVIELMFLGVDLASNVKRIRTNSENKK